jgi:uncharacterized membrane protein YhdT
MLIVVLLYLIVCLIVGFKASARGKSFGFWFLFSVFTTPVLPLIILSLT